MIFKENNSTLTLASAPKMSPQSCHITIKYQFFPDAICQGIAHILPIQTHEQLTNIFTKCLTTQQYEYLQNKLMGW